MKFKTVEAIKNADTAPTWFSPEANYLAK